MQEFNTAEMIQRLAAAKAIFNEHYNALYDLYPEIVWRLRQMDMQITVIEDQIDSLLAENTRLTATRRTPVPKAEEIVQAVLEQLDLKTYESL
ncbi:hypothetical protein [Runella slithyformis]|uniref:Uncharacterized protein n=1 Tax=Runella slithyformis (strain ATCC 29530 / DSM 19594 / LMG 11500 / NCIMB 11436 / LSU 4) TaxID=761193 RepID=A0A7U4E4P6_RUNSL|nr:hypothetical protein [Runella slithyformis]AEI47643.1 hypothetical protein Runsl_1215 [Runella slithyformis DSM 19594]